ncbi:MAG: hypothetical protein QGH94_20725, partial [Phycisphaerae bacterium]|nr:hypothetical protein [Phycisphaerae bacterium]
HHRKQNDNILDPVTGPRQAYDGCCFCHAHAAIVSETVLSESFYRLFYPPSVRKTLAGGCAATFMYCPPPPDADKSEAI